LIYNASETEQTIPCTKSDLYWNVSDDGLITTGDVTANEIIVTIPAGDETATMSTIKLTIEEPATTFTITASAGEGGSISPSGTITVPAGGEQKFTITTNLGYFGDIVLIDGESVILSNNTYTFTNVQKDHTIAVSFRFLCGGEGTELSPYLICDNSTMATLAAYVNAGNGNATAGKFFKLMTDLDLGGYVDDGGWTPIGNNTGNYSFQGTFDGGGYVV
jgi:hypothetical protein